MKKLIYFLMFLHFSSCSNKLSEGDIIEKKYEPTRTYVSFIPLVTSYGKNIHTTMIPYVVTDYEDYILVIKGKYEGKETIENIYINKEQYECLSVGEHFNITQDCSKSDDNNLKIRKSN